jgi:tetratricopeptide (TPR) repeat protein
MSISDKFWQASSSPYNPEDATKKNHVRGTSAPAAPPDFVELFNDGLAHHRAGRLVEAEVHYRRVLAGMPNHADTLGNLGVVAYQLGRYELAIELIGQAIQQNGKNPSYHICHGVALQALSHLEEAIEAYHQALALEPDNTEALNNCGLTLAALKRFDEALGSYDRALAIRPDYAATLYNRANTLQALDRLDEAVAGYDRAIAVKPDFAEAYVNRGQAVQALNSLDEAVASYDRAIALKPDFAEAYFSRGQALQALDRLDDAVADHNRAIAVKPDFAEAYVSRGQALQALDHLDEALDSYDQAIAVKPDFAEADFSRGQALQALDRLDEAVAGYDRAIAVKPDFAEAYLSRGQALQALDRLDDAVADYDRSIAVKPDFAEAYFSRGQALQALDRLDDAVASYHRAIAVTADLGGKVLLAHPDRLKETEACYREALRLQPEDAETHNNLGIILLAQHRRMPEGSRGAHKPSGQGQELGQFTGDAPGRLDELTAHFERALIIKPDYAAAHANLGSALVEQGKLDDAIARLKYALTIEPNFAQAHHDLAVALLHQGGIDESFAAFRRNATLRFSGTKSANDQNQRSLVRKSALPHKSRHDREQLDYITSISTTSDEVYRVAKTVSQGPQRRADLFDSLFHLEGGARCAPTAVSPNIKTHQIEAHWRNSSPKLVVIDDFLTPPALDELRRFCWGSTVWRLAYRDGYLGALLSDGFACPLLGQISIELAAKIPRIFGKHRLTQLWGFKYDSARGGTEVHADYAAVNVNFWITADEANLDPVRGGLVIWDLPAPADWAFEKYNNRRYVQDIRKFLAERHARSIIVPYRCNRAVVFDSDLFHETDQFAFRHGYLNRRINITMLYGFRNDAAGDGNCP